MKNLSNNHFAVLLEQGESLNYKKVFPKSIFGSAVFSERTLIGFIDVESRRDTSIFIEEYGQSLRSMSSGERKVALFKHLISLNPKILIVENFYEHLDRSNRLKLQHKLSLVSKQLKIIQVLRKEKELFPFIDEFYIVNRNEELELFQSEVSSFFKEKYSLFEEIHIPTTTTKYVYDYTTFVKMEDVNVSFYDKFILKNISWEIKLGEFWQLVGENGAGKTTLLSLITGDSDKAYGQNIVLFDKLKGTEENVWEIKQKIGYFTTNITELFNKRHSALHMVLSGFYDSIGLYVKPLSIHVHLAKEWFALLGLTSKMNNTFETLTLAEQRLVLIARAMVKHPPLLILDEPTSGLNKENTALIVALINKIAQETKTTIVYVSHVMEQGLSPDKTFKLNTTVDGSRGVVLN